MKAFNSCPLPKYLLLNVLKSIFEMSPWLSFPPAGGESRALNSYNKQMREDYNYS